MKKIVGNIKKQIYGKKNCVDGVSRVVVKKGNLTMILQERDGVCVLPSGQLAWVWGV